MDRIPTRRPPTTRPLNPPPLPSPLTQHTPDGSSITLCSAPHDSVALRSSRHPGPPLHVLAACTLVRLPSLTSPALRAAPPLVPLLQQSSLTGSARGCHRWPAAPPRRPPGEHTAVGRGAKRRTKSGGKATATVARFMGVAGGDVWRRREEAIRMPG